MLPIPRFTKYNAGPLARFVYRWMRGIWHSSKFKPAPPHIRVRTNSQTILSQLNHLADHLTTRSNLLSLPTPSLPLPTFFMDDFILYSSAHGYGVSLPSLTPSLHCRGKAWWTKMKTQRRPTYPGFPPDFSAQIEQQM